VTRHEIDTHSIYNMKYVLSNSESVQCNFSIGQTIIITHIERASLNTLSVRHTLATKLQDRRGLVHFLHENGLTRARACLCWHRNGLAGTDSVLAYGYRGWPTTSAGNVQSTFQSNATQFIKTEASLCRSICIRTCPPCGLVHFCTGMESRNRRQDGQRDGQTTAQTR